MIDEEEIPKPPPPRFVPLGLAPLGVAELTAYRAELVQEIARVDQEIAGKQTHRSAAEAFFRKP